jgi:hypothetical protein
LGEHYFVSVSRAQADNNLHMLLEAFSNSQTIAWSSFPIG